MPRKAGRLIAISLLGAAGVAIAVTAAGLGFRAYRQHLAAETLAIRSPNGVQEGRFVDIGGIRQWIEIRGEDRDNPVLLFVHGGPGGTTLPVSSGWRSWEKHFTVVQWDQRGTSRTYGAAGEDTLAPTMTLERMTQDGVELAEYLRAHLHKDRIVLVGHSWGSFLGIHMAKQRPDLFSAYVGTGQVVGRTTFEKAFELKIARLQALAASTGNNEALAELAPIAARPIMSEENRLIAEKWSRALALPVDRIQLAGQIPPRFMPDFSLLDWYNWRKGVAFSTKYLTGPDGPMVQHDTASMGLEFSIPMFFIEGDADGVTPGGPAEQYFSQIIAPHKEFVWIRGGDHFLPFNRPDEFLAELLARVRAFARN
ncbi:alpha/beta fold hydrolase [Bradyrhizobium sp. CCBAU 45389]|uniref:alpha/beta fold hydrolase n=1 Tax=Bradyrhizobium sp. CCBAU 45389 TaxID=858429 RepID=UPI0023052A0C|nr:alpha/beta fold hydrolase [Bradyrhizobium sp. CCBAU 45389]MDA9403362.1 proline iminopeptidase [Bradyrhizobium sp. CCBAU 45389]